jgi:hypothetical protein
VIIENMGVVDDYYGGYETLALFTNSDGEVDFEAAYDSQLPCSDSEDDQETDPFMRACNYKFKSEITKAGIDVPKSTQGSRRKILDGWVNTGSKTSTGRPIYKGNCTTCKEPCTVPFAPNQLGDPPKCKSCLAKRTTAGQKGSSSSSGKTRDRFSNTTGADVVLPTGPSPADAKRHNQDTQPRTKLDPTARAFTPGQ